MITAANETDKIRNKVALELLHLLKEGELEDKIDTIPYSLYPKDKKNIRCCVYKDRAITRFRILALLGFDVEKDDELRPLSEYALAALKREEPERMPLTLIADACRSCSSGKHIVTDLCQGCVAKYCKVNCPKDAIIIANSQAQIIEELCVNCGKCQAVCPYNAISYLPIPCEESCPVDAIKKDANAIAHINEEECIACGNCMRSCPFGAVELKSELFDVALRLKDKSVHLSALIAPSIAGQFPGSVKQTIHALKLLGFDSVYEVAAGADMTAKEEAKELAEVIEEESLLTSSCCPAYVRAAKKHIPEIAEYISNTASPAEYSAAMAKGLQANTQTIFIGPCASKKIEARESKTIDYTITFEELASLFIAYNIDTYECEESEADNKASSNKGRMFAESGGVAKAILSNMGENATEISYRQVAGLNRKNISLLKQIAAKKIQCDLVEVMACEGGCIYGPGAIANPRLSARKLGEYIKDGEKEKSTIES